MDELRAPLEASAKPGRRSVVNPDQAPTGSVLRRIRSRNLLSRSVSGASGPHASDAQKHQGFDKLVCTSDCDRTPSLKNLSCSVLPRSMASCRHRDVRFPYIASNRTSRSQCSHLRQLRGTHHGLLIAHLCCHRLPSMGWPFLYHGSCFMHRAKLTRRPQGRRARLTLRRARRLLVHVVLRQSCLCA